MALNINAQPIDTSRLSQRETTIQEMEKVAQRLMNNLIDPEKSRLRTRPGNLYINIDIQDAELQAALKPYMKSPGKVQANNVNAMAILLNYAKEHGKLPLLLQALGQTVLNDNYVASFNPNSIVEASLSAGLDGSMSFSGPGQTAARSKPQEQPSSPQTAQSGNAVQATATQPATSTIQTGSGYYYYGSNDMKLVEELFPSLLPEGQREEFSQIMQAFTQERALFNT